jgi:hypothetical protein
MAKRIFKGVILFFAIYAFVFVPLGKKTALEHIRAIIGTPAAQEAAEEVKGGVTRLVRRLQSEARQSTERSDRRERDDAEDKDEARVAEPAEPPRQPQLRALSAESAAPGQR